MSSKKILTCNFCKSWSVDTNKKNWNSCLGGHQRHCRLQMVKKNQSAILRALHGGGSSRGNPSTPAAGFGQQDDLPNEQDELPASSPPLYWHEDLIEDEDNYESISAPQSIPAIQPVDEMTFLRKPFVVDQRTIEFCKVSLSALVEDINVRANNRYEENKYFDYQQQIIESFPPAFDCTTSDNSLSTLATCLLNEAIVQNGLSPVKGADLFLGAFKSILEEAGVGRNVIRHIPLSARSLKRNILEFYPEFFTPTQYLCKIGDILGYDIRGEAVGWSFDIMAILADELLHLNDYDIHLEPVKEYVTNPATAHAHHQCFRSSFASGLVFEEMSIRVRSDYDDTTICLPIAVSVDDTAFGGLRNRSSAPVYIKILTVKEPLCWKEQHIRLIGFCPRLNVRRIANLL
jgi:hypothetical protein